MKAYAPEKSEKYRDVMLYSPSKTFSDSQLPSTLPSQQRKDSKWEILTSLEQGATYNLKPEAYADFLTKRRKWPLKGKKPDRYAECRQSKDLLISFTKKFYLSI